MTTSPKEIRVLDIFEIKGNDDRKQWEFTPRVEGYTSYTVSYSEASTKSDAILAVYHNLKNKTK